MGLRHANAEDLLDFPSIFSTMLARMNYKRGAEQQNPEPGRLDGPVVSHVARTGSTCFASAMSTSWRRRAVSATNTSRPHDLWAIKLSDNPDVDEDEPEVFLTSTMHGDEITGYGLMLRLLDELTTGYSSDPDLTGGR